MYLQKVISKKLRPLTKRAEYGSGAESTAGSSSVSGMDLQIRILTKMSQICNTAYKQGQMPKLYTLKDSELMDTNQNSNTFGCASSSSCEVSPGHGLVPSQTPATNKELKFICFNT